ncbi:MAG: response regulator [Desulfobacterales bacterium]|nr:response regulator [Desulfobacterales bacterium]
MIDIETMSILVVDDIKSMRMTIRKMLRNLRIGKDLRVADNGRKALDELRTNPTDLVIVDWNMPVMNGTQMLEELRNDKNLRDIPVIMVTAENERDIVSEVAEIEIGAYLLKPLTLAALEDKVHAVVNAANYPDEASQHLLKARDMEESKDFNGAIEEVRKALVYKPSASRILRKMGLLHFNVDKKNIGEKCLQKAVSVNRQDTISRFHLAEYYIKQQELEKAGNLYLEILTLSDRYSDIAVELGEKLIQKGTRSLALRLFSEVAARLTKRKSSLKDRILKICMDREEYDYSKQLLDDMIRDNPSNHEIVFKAGETLLKMGEEEKALEYFEAVDKMTNGDVASKIEMAKICFHIGQLYKADDYLNEILKIDPDNKEVMALRREL